MAGVLDSVDSRTQLAGTNRLELLLFRLGGRQLYGINVFKVQEVIRCPKLTRMPKANNRVVGVAHLRNKTIPIMDLSLSINNIAIQNIEECFVIVTEYNRYTQGFLVNAVDRIANMNWKEILPPPQGSGASSYLTAVTHVDEQLVEIIDVEKIFADVMGLPEEVSEDLLEEAKAMESERPRRVLIVDDSSVARNQMKRVMEKAGIECIIANDGQHGYETLKDLVKEGTPLKEQIAMVISDIEMPRMDGYTLTTNIRKDPELQDIFVMLHTSLSGVFNNSMVEKVGANHFVPKFKPDELVGAVLSVINKGYVD
ncbi:MAG: chemotaxis protein CheV [Gammaproteobacteria bacterium]|nr:chemotaxis protein CheV [Gammaproteobacteria bacterium]MCW8908986.1 chemotaxis protein CheV [Gammaproteobacteria bacterium]MCW9004562.1 chemotaxis protein CheV [Gammaproteobacteria bacterium]MCW9055953.1 chemotaxis protein CheV [Gammaproteobacteria bacterium]